MIIYTNYLTQKPCNNQSENRCKVNSRVNHFKIPTMSKKRKLNNNEDKDCLYRPANKKRRLSLQSQLESPPPPSPPSPVGIDSNIINNLVSSFQSEFSCGESSQFSVATNIQNSQNSCSSYSQNSENSCSSIDSVNRLAENIPSVLLQEILTFNTPFDLSVIAVINKFYNKQCKIRWQRLREILISPKLFPSLIEDDYDSQFEYNPRRHPHRTHFTLNWVIKKIGNYCNNLRKLKIERTMMNGQMFQILITNCPNLTELHLGMISFFAFVLCLIL